MLDGGEVMYCYIWDHEYECERGGCVESVE